MRYGLQALKLILGLLTLILALRLLGKKNLSQLTPYDVVYIVVFGGILDATFYNDDIGLLPYVFSLAVWTASIYLINILVNRFELLRTAFKGTPDQIVDNGKLNLQLFKNNKLEMEQLRTAMRKNGVFSLKEVRDIFLESDGTFSVHKYADYQPVTNIGMNIKQEDDTNVLLIDEGEIETDTLKYIGKSKTWLEEEMEKLGIADLGRVAYCEWSPQDGFFFITKDDTIKQKREGHVN